MTTIDFPPGISNRTWPQQWPDWINNSPRLTGRQWPEYECWHPGDESEGDRTTRFGTKVGVHLLPWEWMIVRAVFSERPENEFGEVLYTHRNVVIECTRQQGKTLLIILIVLRKLFKHRRRVVYTAQQWATVEDVFDRVVSIIERTPSLRSLLAAAPSKKDNRGTLLLKPMPGDTHIVKADFGPRTQHFARGFTEIDDLILDESYDLVPKHTANLTGAQAASDNAQTIYASTAPVISEHPNCHRLAGFVRTIIAGGAPGLYGALYRAPDHFKRDELAAYPLAQPSYGVVGNDREMEAHLQGAKDAGAVDLALFDADWLGWGDYPPPENRRESEIPAEKWTAMRNPGAKLTGSRTLVLTREANWAITAAQRTADGRIHPEVGYAADVSADTVVAKLVEVYAAWDPCAVIVSRGAAAEVVPALEAAGIEVMVPTRTEEAQACGAFLSDALAGLMSHSGQAGLELAVANAVKKEIAPSGFVWEVVDAASHAQLMGATLARWALVKYGTQPKRKPVAPKSGAHLPSTHRSTEFDVMSASF